jgi:hypothetical protein
MGKFVGGRPSAGGGGSAQEVKLDSLIADRFPAIWDYCTSVKWDDGKPRSPATLLLFVEDGLWKLCLNDRARERTAWAAGETVFDCLDAMEANLAAETAVWRRKPPDRAGGGRK